MLSPGARRIAVREAPASFGPLWGLGVASNVWACLFLRAKSGRFSPFWRESWLRYGFGRTRRRPRPCAYIEGSVWLESREGGAARPMQGTFSGVHAHCHRAVLTARAAAYFVVCLFHSCRFVGPKRHHLLLILVHNQSPSLTCLSCTLCASATRMTRRCTNLFFPDTELEQQVGCACQKKVQ